MQNTREEFKKRVIELIHGLPYKKAIKKERQASFVTIEMVRQVTGYFENGKYWEVYPITIGRVMQAFKNNNIALYLSLMNLIAFHDFNKNEGGRDTDIEWKLIKEYGEECTDDDQKIETIEKLYSLLSK
jgi:hypothetical protein